MQQHLLQISRNLAKQLGKSLQKTYVYSELATGETDSYQVFIADLEQIQKYKSKFTIWPNGTSVKFPPIKMSPHKTPQTEIP